MFPKLFRRETPVKPSFESVVDSELPVLYRVALRLTLNQAEAEDLVGQTLYLGARAWATFDGEHPRAWLIRILRNEHLALRRREATVPMTALEDAAEPSDEGYWMAIDWKLVGDQILLVLDKLPEDFRIVIALCDVEELTRDEAAEALGISVGTVNSRLHRGRNLLRSQLANLLQDMNYSTGAAL